MEEKKIEAQRAKPRTPTPAMDALTGDEEQTGGKEENKERKRERVSNPPMLDHSVASYNPQGSCSESILVTPSAHREKYNNNNNIYCTEISTFKTSCS